MPFDATNPSATARLSFSEEFDSLDLWNGQGGRWSTTFWWSDPNGPGATLPTNGEQQWYINSNYAPTASVRPWTVDGGVLSLTASRVDPWVKPLINGYEYVSGTLNTYHSFSQTYGYFEMSAQMPPGQGMWPAFWLLPASGVSPPPELDIVEVIGREPNIVHTAFHRIDNGVYADIGGKTYVESTTDRFHTYGVNWQPDKITWYFDGKAIQETPTSTDMHQPMYMIVNLAVGGHWAGMVDGSTPLPGKMLVDYIRVYKDVGAVGEPPPPVTGGAGSPPANGGPDHFVVSQAGQTLTGGEGPDTFAFTALPWRAGVITDFKVGVDRLDLSAVYSAGYQGADPVADGYLSFVDNGAGGTRVMLDPDGPGGANPWPFEMINLNGVSPYGLTAAQVLGGQPAGPSIMPTAPPTTGGPIGNAEVIAAPQFESIMSGGEGADTFSFGALPWRAGTITDFKVGVDRLDVSQLYRGGYQGADPVGDGYLSFVDNGIGGTRVLLDVDGRGADSPWPYELVNLAGVSPYGLTAGQVLGGAPANPPPPAAQLPGAVITSRFEGDRLIGGGGADTLVAGRGADILTGGAGTDHFTFGNTPWRAGSITDFTPGVDVLDLKGLFAPSNYWGSNPLADGYIQLAADNAGGTQVYFDLDGPGWYGRMLVTTLEGIAPVDLQTHHDWIIR